MKNTMLHRGSNGYDVFIDKNLGLAHRRLSIIDLNDRSAQSN